jgi:RNA polymerase sigma-70 factor (ECF subfamily)
MSVHGIQDDLGAADVRPKRTDRLFYDEPDPGRSSEVHDGIALLDEIVHEEVIEDASQHEPEARMPVDAVEIPGRSGGEVVEDDDVIAPGEKRLAEVGTDESRTACNEITHDGQDRSSRWQRYDCAVRPMGTGASSSTLFGRALMLGRLGLSADEGTGGPTGKRREGEGLDWADVVARYADVVYTMAYRLTGDDEEARDLAQDVLIRLHRGLSRYREGNFEGWLYRTTVNAFRDRLRKRKRLREDALPPEPPGMRTGGIVEEEIQQHELHEVVQRALMKLPPSYREAVVLRDLQGRSYDEIADILEIAPGTVRSRIHRGREALRQILESYVNDRESPR